MIPALSDGDNEGTTESDDPDYWTGSCRGSNPAIGTGPENIWSFAFAEARKVTLTLRTDSNNGADQVWYFDAPSAGTYSVTITIETGFDSAGEGIAMVIWTADCGSMDSDDIICGDEDDEPPPTSITRKFTVGAPKRVYILVEDDNEDGNGGEYTLTITGPVSSSG
ncbi:MAG: hypothetical protein GY847_23940 [Proteobacteria bacterium]|nr:hypothetical protein [Pseudomonadota bacterium]